MYDPGIGRWISEDPIGFKAGDSNLYRYVGNNPTNNTDPSGLSGWNAHFYPLHLGGSGNQRIVDMSTISRAHGEAAQNASHRFLAQQGFGPNSGAAGRAAWARLTARQQQAMIMRSMRAANLSNSFIRANIASIMSGANPGVPTVRPSGFPGGVVRAVFRVVGGVAGGAILTLLTNPGTASAAELDLRWRGIPLDTRGNVQITERCTTYDMPCAWNLFASEPIEVGSATHPEWMDLGSMTAREARELHGVDEVREGGGAFDTRPGPPFGYYRVTIFSTEVRFEEQPQPNRS